MNALQRLALGGWVAFAPMHGEAMVMGDLVLLETEITPVMTKLLDAGLDITALHNHILRATPSTFYMHVGGHGDPAKMAEIIHAALSTSSKTPFDPPPASPAPQAPIELDTGKLDETLGVKGVANGGVYQFNIPRRDPIVEDGMTVNAALGGANAINFQPTGGGKAAITGDFLVTGGEVNPLIRALRAGDIEVTAIHSHMLDENPRLFFIHFWANDDAQKLARNVRAALEKNGNSKELSRCPMRSVPPDTNFHAFQGEPHEDHGQHLCLRHLVRRCTHNGSNSPAGSRRLDCKYR
ncbi:hypothetical protein V1281_001432 [Nitrobacteraceae bacterium AZCC 2161]